MAILVANEVSVEGGLCRPRGFGGMPPTSKKRVYPLPRRGFFEDGDITVHTCTTKHTQNNHKNKLNISKETKLKKNNKQTTQKLKTTALIAITLMITSCATTNQSNKIALRIIKNNNVILKEIKKERNDPKLINKVKSDLTLLTAERRLMMALDAIIESNDSLKKRFPKKSKKEKRND